MKSVILYVHVPFCSSKCHFCSWVSPIPTTQLVKSRSHYENYIQAVVREIESSGRSLSKSNLEAKLVYFGGGTPSLLSSNELGQILDALFRAFPKNPEFQDVTIEVSPHTATREQLEGLLRAGFTRISFGAQSFNKERVRMLGRAHSAQDTVQAFNLAREVGFTNLNIDLMVGLPEETQEEADDSVRQAIALAPDHLSIYIYKKFPSTVLSRMIDDDKIKAVSMPTAVDRYERACRMATAAGYTEYMFQLFHKNEKRCFCDDYYFHMNYDYLGFGQGAHALAAGHCYGHTQPLDAYLSNPRYTYFINAAASESVLETKFFEMMHTLEGFDELNFFNRLRLSFADARLRSPRLQAIFDSALETEAIEPTARGFRFNDRRKWLTWLAHPSSWNMGGRAIEKPELVSIAS